MSGVRHGYSRRQLHGVPERRHIGVRGRLERALRIGAAVVVLGYWSPWRLGVVSGESMAPTLSSGQLFIYDRRVSARPGEIVLAEMGGGLWVKRVFASGGGSFWALQERADSRTVTPINEQQRERFERMLKLRGFEYLRLIHYQVPKDQVFLMGDGVTSLDSRQLGPVPQTSLRGRVVAVPAQLWQQLTRRSYLPLLPE